MVMEVRRMGEVKVSRKSHGFRKRSERDDECNIIDLATAAKGNILKVQQ
jgi:hypothetical protein